MVSMVIQHDPAADECECNDCTFSRAEREREDFEEGRMAHAEASHDWRTDGQETGR